MPLYELPCSILEAQRYAAQQKISSYGSDFVIYTVYASSTNTAKYRADDEPNVRVSFEFIRSTPADDGSTAPYQIHTIDINDRDPSRSLSFIPGEAWVNPPRFETQAAAFQTVQISPREAIRQAQTDFRSGLGAVANIYDIHAELVLAEAVPKTLQSPAVWRVATTTYSDDTLWVLWIDARIGTVLQRIAQPK